MGRFSIVSNVIFIPACGNLGEDNGAFLIHVPPKKEPKDRDRFFVMLCLHVFGLTFFVTTTPRAVDTVGLTLLVGGFFFYFHPYLRTISRLVQPPSILSHFTHQI